MPVLVKKALVGVEVLPAGCSWPCVGAQIDQPVHQGLNTLPPTIFPSVTGIRLETIAPGVIPLAPSSQPSGRKYILATECSKPSAAKAVIGKMIARILPETRCALIDNQTARQTSALQRTPRTKASDQDNDTFPVAIAVAVSATAPSPRPSEPDQKTIIAVAPAPTKFAI